MSHNSLEFIIEGLVFEEPVPFQVALRSRLDLESGDYQISEDSD
jgi:predicted component of type VI protein secretion system